MKKLLLLGLSIFIFGCLGEKDGDSATGPTDEEGTTPEVSTFAGAKVMSTAADLPSCDSDAEGQLFYVIADEVFKYCDGSSYKSIDLTGPSGLDGAAGIDGVDGVDGVDGATGVEGAEGVAGADGVDGATGADGTAGVDGANGLDGNDCSGTVITEGVEITCGGVVIDTIIDGTDGVDGIDGTSAPRSGSLGGMTWGAWAKGGLSTSVIDSISENYVEITMLAVNDGSPQWNAGATVNFMYPVVPLDFSQFSKVEFDGDIPSGAIVGVGFDFYADGSKGCNANLTGGGLGTYTVMFTNVTNCWGGASPFDGSKVANIAFSTGVNGQTVTISLTAMRFIL